MEPIIIDPRLVSGWGIDADPPNDPTWPIRMRERLGDSASSWERPPQQVATVEVLISNERPHAPAILGVSVPPCGLSGVLRRRAFKYSESSYGHWLPLMLADRIGAIEGIISDVVRGHTPNFMAELGWRAEWRFNRGNLILRNLLRLGVVLAVIGSVVL